MPEKKIYSLSNLTQSIQNVISAHCNKVVWIKAEIVKLNYYSKSGHCYPTLAEKKNGKIIAELRGNIWNAHFELINNKFRTVLKEELKDDMTVVVQGTVTYHPLHGLALNIIDIDPEYTLGELAREKAETIEKLKSANIFSLNKQATLPALVKTIAIISVETSKGYGDFMNIIKNNEHRFQFHFLLFPAILQGERGVTTIKEQLDKIENYAADFDAVAIIRGGGGEIGLSCFDNYSLAEKIATFPLPVLTGIGHSNNETVSELVSYQSLITPTKIAEFLLVRFQDFSRSLEVAEQKLQSGFSWLIKEQKNNLKDTARLFSSLTTNFLNASRTELAHHYFLLKNSSSRSFLRQKNELDQVKQLLLSLSKKAIEEEKNKLHFTEEKLKILSPENILKRGFSITRQNGKIVKDVQELQPDTLLETQLYSGKMHSRIEKTTKELNDDRRN